MSDVMLGVAGDLAVFEHAKRREWGLGIIAWEDQRKRGYVFENGQLRVLAEEFYPLMREVDRPEDEIQALYAALKPELEAARKEAGVHDRLGAQRRGGPSFSFDDQLSVFRAEYPNGFTDPKWLETQRGAGSKKRLARHRDSAIARARTELGAEELRSLQASHQHSVVIERALSVLRETDLVAAPELSFRASDDTELASALVELLHGEAGIVARLDRFVAVFQRTVRRAPSWQFATALLALVHENDQICVRPASFREQASSMAPRLVLGKVPNGAGYARCLSVAKLVRSRLVEQGEEPRDMMDVHDFVRITTRPAAKKLLAGLKSSRAARSLAEESRQGKQRQVP